MAAVSNLSVPTSSLDIEPEERPSFLVSFFFLKNFQRISHTWKFRDWVMDSGAFSAMTAKKPIDHQKYLDTCKELLKTDPTLKEVFGLDVIKGDWRDSLKNYEEAWRQGVPAIPCWHRGEPWDVLEKLARDYPKIAIGGLIGTGTTQAQKRRTIEQVFARIWPKPIHGFGLTNPGLVLEFPFHSVDASTWALAPIAFGKWKQFGDISVRGYVSLQSQIYYYLTVEANARRRWRCEMTLLGDDYQDGPHLRLVNIGAVKGVYV
jgi:hypothetical protein